MEHILQQAHSENLEATLNCYRLSSIDSLSGPSSYNALAAHLWYKENKASFAFPPPPPLIQIPLLMPNDTSTQLSETTLGGERIACFIVGGEKRLCLPQILTTVLRDFSIHEINKTCAELHIYCSRCSNEQRQILLVLNILPPHTNQCGLITKTDAERLISALEVEFHPYNSRNMINESMKGIRVEHKCFGKGKGVFYPELYDVPDSICIACMDCRISFSPRRFVTHSHGVLEKRICHWGFDRDNWRNYIQLPNKIEESKRPDLEKILKSLKDKFDVTKPRSDQCNTGSPSATKRRLNEDIDTQQQVKRMKEEKPDESIFVPPHRIPPVCYGFPFDVQSSAFKPWHPGLQQLVTQEEALKALVPLMHDRRLLPGYLQFGTPAIISPPQDATEWANVLNSRVAPNVALTSAEQQKRTSGVVLEKKEVPSPFPVEVEAMRSVDRERNQNRRRTSEIHASPRKREASSEHLGVFPSSSYVPTALRRSSKEFIHKTEVCNAHYPREASRSERLSNDSTHSKSGGSEKRNLASNSLELRTGSHVRRAGNIVKSETIDLTHNVNSDSKVVAAASAMLELSSALKESRRSHESVGLPSSSSDAATFVPPNSSPLSYRQPHSYYSPPSKGAVDMSISKSVTASVTFPEVMQLDDTRNHYKWSFRSVSHIISAAGTQELKSFGNLLDSTTCDRLAKEKLLYEVVKMKARYEEKLDIQERVQRDVEGELQSLRASHKRCLQDSEMTNRRLLNDLEKTRHDHSVRLTEAHNTLLELGKQLQLLSNSSGKRDQLDSQQLVVNTCTEKLYQQIVGENRRSNQLQVELSEERSRRVEAEIKLEKLLKVSRDQMTFLMNGRLQSMLYSSKCDDETTKQHHPLSANSRKNLEVIASPSSTNDRSTASPIASHVGQPNEEVVVDVTTVFKNPSSGSKSTSCAIKG